MNLGLVKESLMSIDSLKFELPDGSFVPDHFHITEVGAITRHFIDCGGTERIEKTINFQLWLDDNDTAHRLKPGKLHGIVQLAERKLGLGNLSVEVEYQGATIEKFGLDFNGTHFLLVNKQTDCLAKELCGVPVAVPMTNLIVEQADQGSCCDPSSGCC